MTETQHPEADAGDRVDARPTPPSPKGRRTRWLLWALLTLPLLLVAIVVGGWAIDGRGGGGSEVARNTEIAGEAVGGLDRDELRQVVSRIADRYATTDVVVQTPAGELAAPGADLGLALEQGATIDAALAVGTDGSLLERPFAWAASFLEPRDVPVAATVDEAQVSRIVAERDPTDRRAPIEPSIRGEGGAIVVVAGEDGQGLLGAPVSDAIAEAADAGEFPVVVQADPAPIPPRFADDVAALAERAGELTAEPIAVEGTDQVIPVEMQRNWVRSTVSEDGPAIDFPADVRAAMVPDLEAHLPDLGDDPVDAGITVQGGSVVIVPSKDGTACCDPAVADRLVEVITDPAVDAVAVPLRARPAERTAEDAAALGIREVIGSFTTNFTPGQSRNQNIQRMADLVRGVVVEPGGQFSVNDHVGRRTRERGFTDGGEIRDGKLETAVGGGVSQFATTMFNAAFFAGLEIPEYQMHSLYFTRYPYGREATLSFPKPDLVIENNTGHGILLWPTHTGSSVTVSIYGTRTFDADQTGQREEPAGPCTKVTTDRTRTRLSNGSRTTDSFVARYRPEEGVDC